MQVLLRTKRCRGEKELVPVPAVHEPVSLPFEDPALCKHDIYPMRRRIKEVNLVVGTGKSSEGRRRAEWLPCVVELLDDAQGLHGTSSPVRASYSVESKPEEA